jgi:hypothetical protein
MATKAAVINKMRLEKRRQVLHNIDLKTLKNTNSHIINDKNKG